jgi:hypothetical protein
VYQELVVIVVVVGGVIELVLVIATRDVCGGVFRSCHGSSSGRRHLASDTRDHPRFPRHWHTRPVIRDVAQENLPAGVSTELCP